MPAERRAQFRVPNAWRSQISKCAPFRIYEHAQCRLFECTFLHCAYVIPCWQQMGSSAVLQACHSALVLAASTRCLRWAHSIGWGCRVHTYVMAIAADFKSISSVSFVRIRSNFFYNTTQETQTQKNDGPEFWNLNCDFCEFFEIFKKASHSPSVADLDHYGRGQTRSQ